MILKKLSLTGNKITFDFGGFKHIFEIDKDNVYDSLTCARDEIHQKMKEFSYTRKIENLKKELNKKYFYMNLSYNLNGYDDFDFFYEITGLAVPRKELMGKKVYTTPEIWLKLYLAPTDPWYKIPDNKNLVVVSEPGRTTTELV